jgi:membrane protease YdiL (CAAX protease family)
MMRCAAAAFLLIVLSEQVNGFGCSATNTCRSILSPRLSKSLVLSAAPSPPPAKQFQPTPERVPLGSVDLPRFQWTTGLYFAANPMLFLPVAFGLARVFSLPWLGARFVLDAAVLKSSLMLSLPMILLMLSPIDRWVQPLAEVTRASKTISLYAMGSRLVPLRALVVSFIVSTSAAICEELFFRGVLQTGIALILRAVTPLSTSVAAATAVTAQALLFGSLHSYTSGLAYMTTVTVVGMLFGGAFAAFDNIAIPVLMHFFIGAPHAFEAVPAIDPVLAELSRIPP